MRTASKWIHCTVLRQAGYLPGIWLMSDRHQTMLLAENAPDEPAEDAARLDVPFLVLHRESAPEQSFPGRREIMFARPLEPITSFAFGGNWLWSDDPRFPADHPIPIHDSPASSEADGRL